MIRMYDSSKVRFLSLLALAGALCGPSAVAQNGPRQNEQMPAYGQWHSARFGGGGYVLQTVVSPSDPDRVKTVFDWDMATLGDPLVDLGTLLNYWPDPSDPADDRALHVPGMEDLGLPTRAEVVDHYAAATGFDVTPVPWYEAFATWKTAVVCEQLYQRWVRGESTDPRMGTRGEPVARLCARSARLLAKL